MKGQDWSDRLAVLNTFPSPKNLEQGQIRGYGRPNSEVFWLTMTFQLFAELFSSVFQRFFFLNAWQKKTACSWPSPCAFGSSSRFVWFWKCIKTVGRLPREMCHGKEQPTNGFDILKIRWFLTKLLPFRIPKKNRLFSVFLIFNEKWPWNWFENFML